MKTFQEELKTSTLLSKKEKKVPVPKGPKRDKSPILKQKVTILFYILHD